MSCGCDTLGGNDSYNNLCNTDTPYPIVSAESVPSLISNLTFALYGQIQKDVSNGKVVWIIPCDPNNTAFIGDVPRLPGEGLLCYFIRYFNAVYPGGTLAIEYGGTGAGTAQAALSNLGGASAAQQIITAPSSGLSGGGTLAADRSLSIANTTVVPGTYGANNRIPVLTVNARGQLTGATTIAAEGFASVDGEVITAADPSPNVRQTVFNLTSIIYSPGTDNLAVYRNGLRLLVGQDYIETNSSTVTLTRGVAAGNQFLFESGRIIGQDVSSVAVATQRIVAVNPAPGIQQTVFNLTAITYIPGNNSLAVYSNGLKLSLGLDYTETNSATVTLTNGATAGDQLTFEAGKMLSQPVSATVQTQTITSSLGQTVFVLTTLSYAPNIGNLAVYKDGLRLISGTDYAETNSNTVTLTVPALAGRQFMFEVGQTLAQPAPVAAASELKTATANQTQFTLTGLTYVPNTLSLSVYRNGLKLISGTDYTETNSNTVTLTSPAALGDQLVFEAGKILSQGVAGSSVLFVQSGTGAVTRNMQNKARESVSVLDFGADPTGATDSTLQIQAAINSLGAMGGVVEVPPGTYKVSSTLNISSYIYLKGSGAVASSILTNNSTGNVVYINGVSNSPGCTVENLFFNSSVTRTAGSYIVSNSSNGTFIKNCKMLSAFDGISVTGTSAQNIKIEDCQINSTINYGINITAFNSTSPNTSGIVVSYISRVLVTGAVTPNNCEAGIRIVSAGDLTLYGVSTIYCKKGLHICPTGTNTIQALNVTDSFFDTGDEFGVAVTPETTASVRLANFTNVWCASNKMSGALLGGTGQIITTNWLNCTMAVNIGQGLWIASTLAKNTSVIGGVYAQNSGSGLGVVGGVSNFKIIGATIGRTDSNGYAFGPNAGYGVNVIAGASNNYIISNNIFTENTTGQLFDGGTGVDKTVYPNVGASTAVTINVAPVIDWGVDFAKQGAVLIENGTPYLLGSGSGLVLVHNNTTGQLGMFLAFAGTVNKVSGAATIVSGAAGLDQVGLSYNSGVAKYEVSNGYVAAQQINISTIKTRLAS